MCDNNAPVTYPLDNVKVDASGVGTSSTVVTLTADKPVTANNAYVNVHTGATPPGQGIICANITQSYTATGAAAQGATPAAQAPAATPRAAGATPAAAAPAVPRTGTGVAVSGTTSTFAVAALILLGLALCGGAVVVTAQRRR